MSRWNCVFRTEVLHDLIKYFIAQFRLNVFRFQRNCGLQLRYVV